jgi:hypothetical protein
VRKADVSDADFSATGNGKVSGYQIVSVSGYQIGYTKEV